MHHTSRAPQAMDPDEVSLSSSRLHFNMKDGKYCCSKCDHLFTQKTNLQRHLRKIHKVETTSNARTCCIHPGCHQEFYHKTKLIQHLEEEHGMSTQKSELSFESEDKFFAWKEREESQNYAYFSKERGAIKSSLCIHQTYACQRNGSSRSHKAKGSPARKTSRKMSKGCVKTDMICPARIITAKCLKTGHVKVTYYRSHSHPLLSSDIKFHPLPQKLRDELKLKLAFGVTVEDIQKDLARPNHSNIENLTVFKRQQSISKHHIQQMRRNMFKRAEKNPEGLDSISNLAILLEKHRTDGHNPVMMYKPDGGQYIIGNLTGDALTVDDSPMVIALQTKQQLRILEALKMKFLCVDSVQYEDYLLVNVCTQDDHGRGCPVAHLICSPDDQNALLYFFQAISEVCHKSSLTGIMTDESASCINIISAVFGSDLTHILCKWHVHNDWIQQIHATVMDKELRRELYVSLVLLMEEPVISQFTSMTSKFVNRYRLKAKAFIKYFKDSYLDRCPVWASCYGNYSSDQINTSLYDETFHKPLRAFLSNKNLENEIYDLVNFLLTVEEKETTSRESLLLCQSSSLCSKHEQSLHIPEDGVIKVMSKVYTVKFNSAVVNVKRVKKVCRESLCGANCLDMQCAELCPHLYTCTCSEESRLCSHIHRVHREMQIPFLQRVRQQLVETDSNAHPPLLHSPPLLTAPRLRRSPRHPPAQQISSPKQGAVEINQQNGFDDDDDDDVVDNLLDGGENVGNDGDNGGEMRDPGILFNADPVPLEDDETSGVNLRKIYNVNDQLLFLLENDKVQPDLLPYILKELSSILMKCKSQMPSDALNIHVQHIRRRPKRKATNQLPLLQMKLRGVASQKGSHAKQGSVQANNTEQESVDADQGVTHQLTKTLPVNAHSSCITDPLPYVITTVTSVSSASTNALVYMIPTSSSTPMPLSSGGVAAIGPSQSGLPSPPQLINSGASLIQPMQSATFTSSGVSASEPTQMQQEALLPLSSPLQQRPQHHVFPHVPAPNMTDLVSLSSQLIPSMPPTLTVSSTAPQPNQQEREYIPRQPSMTPSGTIVTQLMPRPTASPFQLSQPLSGIEHSLISTQASQALTLTGSVPTPQTGMAASYLASQLGHRVMPPQPLGQHLQTPYGLTGSSQHLAPVHQATHSLPQPRQYLAPSNQGGQHLQASPFMSTIQPLQHLNPTPTPPPPPQGQQGQEQPHRSVQHHIY
ncbi:uncharacterized protein [Diadema setosum]|uniref:uncharacterized protein n=1 Tax=Diadema setosum TaxID=31175 RepID=UPI003B3B904B